MERAPARTPERPGLAGPLPSLPPPSSVPPVSRLLETLVALAALVAPGEAAPRSAPAQDAVRGRIPVTIVDGRLVVSCDLSTPFRRIPANLLVEFEQPHGLVLHNKAAAPLRCENPDGTTIPIRIHLPEFDLEVPRRELGDEEFMEEFTKYHSEELGENALVGSIGYEVLREHAVRFDLAQGSLHLRPLGAEPAGPVRPAENQDGSWTLPLSEHAGLLWLTVVGEGGTPFAMAVGCSRADTLVDAVVCEQRGRPAGDLGKLLLGGIDLAEFVAPRPEPLALVHPDEPLGVLGINLLRHLSLDVDRRARAAVVRVTRPAEFPEADLDFFRARLSEDADTLEEHLERHAEARLAREAAELLLTWRFDEFAEEEDTTRAVDWIARTTPEDLRTTRMLDLMKVLADDARSAELLEAGRLGIEAGREDRYPNAVHEVHGRMGRERLARDEGREAWRHLLSASFGLPSSGPINLDLGRYYESQGRYRRAFSRYVQAVLDAESGPDALEAMARVQPLLDPDEPFGVDLIERMIAGKVRSYGAPTRYEPDADDPPSRTVLVEFFTNAWLGDDTRGAIGGALGFEGAAAYFEDAPVVFLSHHLPEPRVDPLCTALGASRAARVGAGGPTAIVTDGVRRSAGAGRWRDAEAIAKLARREIEGRLARPTDWELGLEGSLEGGTVRGALDVLGPTEADRNLVVVLTERGVLFPGKTGVVVHRHLARAALTAPGGVGWDPVDGYQRVEFEVALETVTRGLEEHLDELARTGVGTTVRVSTRLDPAQVGLAAWVEDAVTGEVLQAAQLFLGPEDEE